MNRRKDAELFNWIKPDDERQVSWAKGFIIREVANANLTLPPVGGPFRSLIASSSIQDYAESLQLLASKPKSNEWVRKLDARMRKAWGEKLRRSQRSHLRYYQLRMLTSMGMTLRRLKAKSSMSYSEIVEILLTNADLSGGPVRRLSKEETGLTPLQLSFKQQQQLLRLELEESKARVSALRKRVSQLTRMLQKEISTPGSKT